MCNEELLEEQGEGLSREQKWNTERMMGEPNEELLIVSEEKEKEWKSPQEEM